MSSTSPRDHICLTARAMTPAEIAHLVDLHNTHGTHAANMYQAAFRVTENSYWPQGRTITVGFKDGLSWQKEAVVDTVMKYLQPLVNLKFNFVGDSVHTPDVQVSFAEAGSAYSDMGPANVGGGPLCRINLGWLDDAREVEKGYDPTGHTGHGVIKHEFGHMIGLVHEHQRPTASFEWNKPVAYSYFAGFPNHWDKQTVDNNIFKKFTDIDTLNSSVYDKDSIMHYVFPCNIFTVKPTGFRCGSVPNVQDYSVLDKRVISGKYPRVDYIPPTVGDPGTETGTSFRAKKLLDACDAGCTSMCASKCTTGCHGACTDAFAGTAEGDASDADLADAAKAAVVTVPAEAPVLPTTSNALRNVIIALSALVVVAALAVVVRAMLRSNPRRAFIGSTFS